MSTYMQPLTNAPSDATAIKQRIAKFKRRASQIVDQTHLDAVLASFPPSQREAIYLEVRPLITKFNSTFNADQVKG